MINLIPRVIIILNGCKTYHVQLQEPQSEQNIASIIRKERIYALNQQQGSYNERNTEHINALFISCIPEYLVVLFEYLCLVYDGTPN